MNYPTFDGAILDDLKKIIDEEDVTHYREDNPHPAGGQDWPAIGGHLPLKKLLADQMLKSKALEIALEKTL